MYQNFFFTSTFFTLFFYIKNLAFFTPNFDSQKTNLFLAFPVVEDIIEQIQYASEGFTPEEVTTKGEKASCVIM